MPVLFANDTKKAAAGIMGNLATARKDLDRINRVFFVPEHVDLEAARMVVRKPRLGDVHHAFKAKNLDRLFEPISFGPGNKFHLKSTYFITKIEKSWHITVRIINE
jgi:hypothetical protein